MANITNNRLNEQMSPAQFDAVKEALQTILNNMTFLIGLTIKEKKKLPKMNVANKIFAEDTLNAIENNAAVLPPYIQADQIRNDLQLYKQLDEISSIMRQLLEKIDDTQALVGSETYTACLAAYRLFIAAASSGMPGMDSVASQLGARFSGQGPQSKQSEASKS